MIGLTRENTDLLFCNVDWRAFVEGRRSELTNEVDSYHPDRLLNTATDDLVAYFTEKYRIDVPELQEACITAEQREVQIDINRNLHRLLGDNSSRNFITGTRVEIEIPFSGDPACFRVQPQTFSLNPPRAEIRGSTIRLNIEGSEFDARTVRARIDDMVSQINTHLERLRHSAAQTNAQLVEQMRDQIERRKSKLLGDRNLVANLGFPIKERSSYSQTYAPRDVRRKTAIMPPPASLAPYRPEPALSLEDYELILGAMERMTTVMERSPSAFRKIDEEALRTHFLVPLNDLYEGQVSGETFNYEGKTDILIRSEGRNIFIAECKFWKGAKRYSETIDQLLSYLSWRDTKGPS